MMIGGLYSGGGGGAATDGDYGDIVISAAGTVYSFDTAVVTAAARTVLDDTTVAAMVNTLGGATSTGTGGLVRATAPVLDGAVILFGDLYISNTSVALGVINNVNNSSVEVAYFAGSRSTRVNGDEAYIDLMLNDVSGNSREVGRLTWVITDVTAVNGRLDFGIAASGSIADEMQLDSAALSPSSSDGLALGTTSLMWSDLFLASGAVLNFNNGDVTLTHSADTLTLGGGNLALGSNTLTMTGSIASTGARVTKGWFTDLESTNTITVSGVPVLTTNTGQPLDATLTAFAGLTIAANSLTIGTGADAFSQTTFAASTFPARASTGNLEAKTITDFALGLLDDVAASNARTTLDVPSNAEAVLKTFFAAKGDIPTATANDTPSILTVGTDGYVLTADAAEATGLKWAAIDVSQELRFRAECRLTTLMGSPVVSNETGVRSVTTGDTSAETLTVTSHGLIDGQPVTAATTANGLTAGTLYYVNSVTSNTLSFHTTYADAIADTNRVNITGTSAMTIYLQLTLAPFRGNQLALYNTTSTAWELLDIPDGCCALIPSAAGPVPFDVFAYSNAGVVTLETVDWSTGTAGSSARNTGLDLQDGIYVKSGDASRRYIGTGLPSAASTRRVKNINAARCLWNYYNRVLLGLRLFNGTGHSYNTAAWRAWNNDTANRVDFVIGVAEDCVVAGVSGSLTSPSGGQGFICFGNNSHTVQGSQYVSHNVSGRTFTLSGTPWALARPVGYNYFGHMEHGSASTFTFDSILIDGFMMG